MKIGGVQAQRRDKDGGGVALGDESSGPYGRGMRGIEVGPVLRAGSLLKAREKDGEGTAGVPHSIAFRANYPEKGGERITLIKGERGSGTKTASFCKVPSTSKEYGSSHSPSSGERGEITLLMRSDDSAKCAITLWKGLGQGGGREFLSLKLWGQSQKDCQGGGGREWEMQPY